MRRPRGPQIRRRPSFGARYRGAWEPGTLDQQQKLLIALLRRAHGETVSYDELRDAGIEYPATVVSELELSGWPLERSFGATGSRRLGVRLDPRDGAGQDEPQGARDESGGLAPSTQPASRGSQRARLAVASAAANLGRPARAAGTRVLGGAASALTAVSHATQSLPGRIVSSGPRLRQATPARGVKRGASGAPASAGMRLYGPARARWLAPALLLIVAAIATALVLRGSPATTAHRARALHHRPVAGHVHAGRGALRKGKPRALHGSVQPSTATATQKRSLPAAPSVSAIPSAPATPGTTSTSPASSTPTFAASAAQLQARGHVLLAAGQLQAAILTLRHAVAATGENTAACAQPVGEACLTYAFALYDLGRALRLARQPAAAVPILEQRLRIANQRSIVLTELMLARREAARPAATAPTSG